jgi:hypothetical protein
LDIQQNADADHYLSFHVAEVWLYTRMMKSLIVGFFPFPFHDCFLLNESKLFRGGFKTPSSVRQSANIRGGLSRELKYSSARMCGGLRFQFAGRLALERDLTL